MKKIIRILMVVFALFLTGCSKKKTESTELIGLEIKYINKYYPIFGYLSPNLNEETLKKVADQVNNYATENNFNFYKMSVKFYETKEKAEKDDAFYYVDYKSKAHITEEEEKIIKEHYELYYKLSPSANSGEELDKISDKISEQMCKKYNMTRKDYDDMWDIYNFGYILED